tara:strand:- start:676 stop:882 length:207 start_codon:yes stop_codon:yes gene_type:complete
MRYSSNERTVIRYRGFILLEQDNHTWKVQPERSPIFLMPFRTEICSIEAVKELIDTKLSEKYLDFKAA